MNTKPLLPTADKLLPYLRRIDKARDYCNFGTLVGEFEERLGKLFAAPVVTASSATSALTATLIALGLPKGSFVACPSWTFVATPASIVAAGLVPYFFDVGKNQQIIFCNSNIKIAAVVVVSPCGMPINIKTWDAFQSDTKIPVIIDAAGGFDSFSTKCKPGLSPVIISTHGTKAFGTGEGGFVSCHDKKLLEKIRKVTNFGLTSTRDAIYLGMNAKMSEYHAAVGLAELDGWDDKRDKYLRKTKIYGVDYVTSLVPIASGEGRRNVYGCHKLSAYKNFPRIALPITEDLMRKITFMPVCI